tara:strand:- start:158 stop:781 length:624 start_codon:yes stop_codon:yes gene_type:complete
MFEKLIFFIAILSRIDSYIYSYDNREKHNKHKNNKYLYLFIPTTRYTDLSIILSILWSGYIILFNEISNILTCCTWCISCNASIGYWIFRGDILSKDINKNTLRYKVFDSIAHGVIPTIMILDVNNLQYNLYDIIYPLLLSILWLIAVIMPWYMITNDPVYPFLHKDVPLRKKLSICGFMFLNTIFIGFVGKLIIFINNNILLLKYL